MAFKVAGSMAFKEAARMAKPVILEPMMSVEVTTPEDYMGDVIGDINSRRGQVQSMEERTGARVVKAYVPLSATSVTSGPVRRAEPTTRWSSDTTQRFRLLCPRRSSPRRPGNSPVGVC